MYYFVMNGQLLKVKGNYSHPKEGNIKKESTVGMGNGRENSYFAKLLCQLQNRLCDISVVTIKPADCRKKQTSET
jgi:hypothetical protein